MNETMSFGIDNWSDPCSCDNENYKCNDIVSHCDEIYISSIKDNDRHPHDSDAWENLGSAGDILGMILNQDNSYQLSMPYHQSCGGGCVSHYPMDATVAVESPLLDANGEELTDDCGNVQTETLIYSSLIDFNTDLPSEGAEANPPTWTQGVSFIEYLTPAEITASDIVGKICADPAATASLKTCLGVQDPVKYTWVETNSNDGDGVIVWTATGSDGTTQDITIPEPTTDTSSTITGRTIVDGVVTYTSIDADSNPLPNQSLDLTSLISSDHPLFAGAGGTTAAYDAASNVWTITSDVDTFATVSGSTVTDANGNSVTVPSGSTYNPATNEITTSDGQTIALMVDTDTDTFATQNADGDLVLADGTIVPLVVDTDTDTVNQLTVNPDGSVTSQIVDIDGNPVGSPVVIPAPVDAPAVHNGDFTATTDTMTVSTQNWRTTTVNGSGNTGSQEIRRNYIDTETGAAARETINSMPRSEVRSVNSSTTIDGTTDLTNTSVLLGTFTFASNLPTRRVIHLSPLHIRKFDFVGFGNITLELTNTTTGQVRSIGGQLAFTALGLHTDGSGHYDEESWSGLQFYDDVEGNNTYELRLLIQDASAFISQGFMEINQATVSTITAMRHEVVIT